MLLRNFEKRVCLKFNSNSFTQALLSQTHSHFITNSIRGHCLCQLEAFVSGFPWLLAKCIQSYDVLRPIKCEQIYLVHDNEQ